MIQLHPNRLLATTFAFLMVAVFAGAQESDHQGETFGGTIRAVEESPSADLVFLQGGLQQGLQNGMLLEVHRGGNPVAELIVVGTRRASAAALILKINPDTTLKNGDIIRVKTRKTSFFS